MKTRLFIILLLYSIVSLKAQTDTLFWFAVPYATLSHNGPLTADLTLSATDPVNITTVTITQPYNPQIAPIVVTIDPAISTTENVSFTQAEILKFSNNLYNSKSNSALLIRSDREITAYYEIHRTRNNPAIFALKGRNALGYDFWTPFQTHWDNNNWDAPSDPAFSQIIIVATQDSTKVTVNFKVAAYGHAANTNYDIYLNAGQTYMFVPRANPADNNDPSILAGDRLVGTHITSNKPISVTLGDDSVLKNAPYDYMGDQHIPVKNAQNKAVIGHEYIIMKGKVSDASSGERVYILTTESTNNITVTHKNGSVFTYTPANAGQQINFTMPVASNDHWVHIYSLKPIYVLHVAGFGHELGEAIVPTIDGCTGSLSVSFTRSKPQDFYLNLMTKADAIDSFYISIDGGPSSHFLSDPNLWEQAASSDWYVLKDANKLIPEATIPTGIVTRIYNTKNIFQLGYFNGVSSGGGCVYGYFSDYNELEATAHVEDQGSVFQVCGVDSIELKAKGGISYKWTPTEYLDNPNTQNPILRPPYGGFNQVFTVEIEQPCHGVQTLQVWVIVPESPNAFMSVNLDNGCAPLDLQMKDGSNGANNFILDLGDGSPLQISTAPINIDHQYTNTTDTVATYLLSYTVTNDDGCNDFYSDTIRVFPQINSSFVLSDANDTTVCNFTTVELRNTSTGNTDTYQWNFGDGSFAVDTLVTHTYTNYTPDRITYPVSLLARSPFGCLDTSDIVTIHVYPYIYSSFTIDSARSCSPARLYINPSVSAGVDTFYWDIHDINKTIINSTFLKEEETPFYFNHDNSIRLTPDTLLISMYAANRFSCYDTATTREIIVYPEVDADFVIDKNNICDSVDILITNKSKGYKLLYEWDFGNGTSLIDTSKAPFARTFLNRTEDNITYKINLTATSDYFCRDTVSLPLTVFPFVDANFAIDFASNCSPLNAELINISNGGDEFYWNFGDGDSYYTLLPEALHHIYENTSDKDTTYYISLKAANMQGCVDSIKREVFLFSQVVADFDFDSPNQGCNPLDVSFINKSKGQNLDYIWDFGDKTFSTSQNPPPRTYKNSTAKDSTYYVNLTVMNLAGCDSSIERTVQVYSKVTADFAIERVDSCSPFKISVDNFSSGGITEFIWKYTPGDSITLPGFTDPDIPVYHNTSDLPVKYPFQLRTRNIHGCSALKSDTITVFPEINASFTPGVLEGCQPLNVSLINNTNIKTGSSFFWNFGDGKYSNLENPPSHLYNNISTNSLFRDIRLEATSQYGCYDESTAQIEVYPYIYAKFSIDRPEACSHELFSIDRNSATGAINHYFWDYQSDGLNDEDKSTAIFNHFYPNIGTDNINRTIKLTVTNAQGCDTSWSESIVIHPQVRADFEYDHQEVCYPAPIRFTNMSEPAIPLTYYWEFGDGSTSAGINPVHPYKNFSRTNDKPFTVKLTASSQYGCDSTISRNVTIHPKPLADFSFAQAVDCPPFEVQFTGSAIGTSLDYEWDFDNGVESEDQNPFQVFYNTDPDVKQHAIRLIVTSDYNCSDTVIKPLQVYPGVLADFEPSEREGCSPMQINLNGNAVNEDEYYWYIDGKVISNYEDPSYRFVNESATDKVFNVRFLAVSSNGCSKDTTKQITIFPNPLVEFLPSPQVQDFNTENDITPVTFNNQTSNQSLWKYKWEFGDGSGSTQDLPSFIKHYSIWGDVNNESRIPVVLTAANPNHPQCADTVMHFVIIKPPLPKIEIGPDVSGCMPLTVDFNATAKYADQSSFNWDFGYQDKHSEKKNPDPIVYDTAGMYVVRVSASGDGGTNWDYKTIQVYPKPVVNFNFDPKYAWLASQTEPGTPIKFFNNTYNAISYLWTFKDGTTSTERQPQHEYTKEGIFYVELKAESEFGCWDTLTANIPLVIEGHGLLEFPNAITIIADNPADEYYNWNDKRNRRIFRPLNEGVDKYRLEIYNRWGELIFESDDVNKGWNGFIQGQPVKQDVYVWRVSAVFTNGQPYIAAGDVTVLVHRP